MSRGHESEPLHYPVVRLVFAALPPADRRDGDLQTCG